MYYRQSKFYWVNYIDHQRILICSQNCKQCYLHIFQCLEQNKYYQLKVFKTHSKLQYIMNNRFANLLRF